MYRIWPHNAHGCPTIHQSSAKICLAALVVRFLQEQAPKTKYSFAVFRMRCGRSYTNRVSKGHIALWEVGFAWSPNGWFWIRRCSALSWNWSCLRTRPHHAYFSQRSPQTRGRRRNADGFKGLWNLCFFLALQILDSFPESTCTSHFGNCTYYSLPCSCGSRAWWYPHYW